MAGMMQYATHNDMLRQLNSVVQTLEYWKGKTTPERAWMIGIAIQMLEHVASDIYTNELHAMAHLGDD